MAASWREESGGRRGGHDIDEGCTRPGRAAFLVAVTVVILAPLVLIVFSFAALSAGFCQDGKPAEDCPSADSIANAFWIVMLAMGATLLGCVVALISSVRRAHLAPSPVPHSGTDGVVRTNRKAIVAGGFAVMAMMASLPAVHRDNSDAVVLGVFLAVPAALLATVFGLRSLAEVHVASGRQSGTMAAEIGVAFGAVVSVGWLLAAVATF